MSRTLKKVKRFLSSGWLAPSAWLGEVRVPTACLYPSGSWVTVTVVECGDWLVVHDAGEAGFEARSEGIEIAENSRQVRNAAANYGLLVRDANTIVSAPVAGADLAATIVLVANASRDAVAALIESRTTRGRIEER